MCYTVYKKAGVYKDTKSRFQPMRYSNGNEINKYYGTHAGPKSDVFYPTVNGIINSGRSIEVGAKNLTITDYGYDKSQIKNADIQNMLFNGYYWLASRCITTNASRAFFRVHYTNNNGAYGDELFEGTSSTAYYGTRDDIAIRPVVTLKSNVIDVVNTNYSTEGEWKLK